jgi:hypothetical protein
MCRVAQMDAVVVPDVAGVVVGWRSWKVALADGGPRLRPMTRIGWCAGAWWPTARPLHAACATQQHVAPDETCSCGVYAASSYGGLDELGYVDRAGSAIAVGTVSLWGSVVECDRGWRAEHAYPRHLFVPPCLAQLAGGLAAAYRIPVEVA